MRFGHWEPGFAFWASGPDISPEQIGHPTNVKALCTEWHKLRLSKLQGLALSCKPLCVHTGTNKTHTHTNKYIYICVSIHMKKEKKKDRKTCFMHLLRSIYQFIKNEGGGQEAHRRSSNNNGAEAGGEGTGGNNKVNTCSLSSATCIIKEDWRELWVKWVD